MAETPEQETARLLQPYLEDVYRLADETLTALTEGRHEEASHLMDQYCLAKMAYESAELICKAFDDGNVTITDNSVEIRPNDAQNPDQPLR